MKKDIDHLMQERNIDAMLVTGPGQHNPAMVYMTGCAKLTHADLIKLRGQQPVLFHQSMERDEAARTGLVTKCLDDYRPLELLKQANGDRIKARVLRYQKMLADLDMTAGILAVYGKLDAGLAFATFEGLKNSLPGLTIIGEGEDSLLLQAMATKDDVEVDRIRKMGEITIKVVGMVAEYLSSCTVRNEVLIEHDGTELTIGRVKRLINLWLAECGAENPEGTIFAIGRDAGVPHSSGTADDLVCLGKTVVFDIYPCEQGGGYFYDFTRTWCLGYAPDEVYKLYEDVYAVFKQISGELRAHAPTGAFQKRACELFEARGHPTLNTNPQTLEGFVHSLGHGVGLQIHELPMLSMTAPETERLLPGAVVTVEPGLYYPEKGMGVRIEDTVWVQPDGQIAVLAEYQHDLVIKVK